MADAPLNFGDSIQAVSLKLKRAVATCQHVLGGKTTYARVVAVHCDASGIETLVLELDVQVPQLTAHSILAKETVAIRFHPSDAEVPEVLALRSDFPSVPHLNLSLTDYPKSLCLYDQPWASLKLGWTAAAFLERIRWWMAQTARGELHGDDQPLEPLLLVWDYLIILPPVLLENTETGTPMRLYVDAISDLPAARVLVARDIHRGRPTSGSEKFVATFLKCDPVEHGVIRHSPRTIENLHSMTTNSGLDLKGELQRILKEWWKHADLHDARLIILLGLPKTRRDGGAIEGYELWAFASRSTIRDLGKRLNCWNLDAGKPIPLIGELDQPGPCTEELLWILKPHRMLSKKGAAACNGQVPIERDRFVAIGAGAIGSQVLINCARSGFGTWTVVDDDLLLPHNVARHALNGFDVGMPKAESICLDMFSIQMAEPHPKAIVSDFPGVGDKAAAIATAIEVADCVLDMSASVPVARTLAAGTDSVRRVSLFLNPSGTDLVLLAEDAARTTKLDLLEHQLYRALVREPALVDHLGMDTGRIRYAPSCRDITSTLPQHLVGLHSAIGTSAFRQAIESPDSKIKVWRVRQPDQLVECVTIPNSSPVVFSTGSWTVCSDESFFGKLRELRASKLPNETGGVLLGSFDLERRIVYLIDTIPSPPDSEEWPTLYIRGSVGLAPEIEQISVQTGGMLQYVGEWHSHPPGVPPIPSEDDCKVFMWLTELMDRDGFPAIMIIAGDDSEPAYIGTMIQGRRPQ